jgi:hypothetical protein
VGNFSIPPDLGPEGQKLYVKMRKEYGPHAHPGFLAELETLARTLCRLRSAEAVVTREGCVFTDRLGRPKPHTACTRVDAESRALQKQLERVERAIGDARLAARFKRQQMEPRNTAEHDPWGRGARQNGTETAI